MNLVLADLHAEAIDAAMRDVELAEGAALVRQSCDVSNLEDIEGLKNLAYGTFERVDVLMNNAGTAPGGGAFRPL